tara:strand:- start:940 stop:1512 length:573 start_codon:yes stop_codon:yes gene_type:complete
MKLVLVPQWVEQAMGREDISPRALLDPEKLLSTLSKEDVAFYVWLNNHLERWLPKAIVETFVTGCPLAEASTKQLGTSCGGALPFNTDQMDVLRDYFMNFQMEDMARRKKEHHGVDSCELFGALEAKCSPDDITFTVRIVGQDTLVLLPKKTKSSSLMGMVNDMLIHLNGRLAFHDVAKTPLFRFFVRTV